MSKTTNLCIPIDPPFWAAAQSKFHTLSINFVYYSIINKPGFGPELTNYFKRFILLHTLSFGCVEPMGESQSKRIIKNA
jgi:hypothetical protein